MPKTLPARFSQSLQVAAYCLLFPALSVAAPHAPMCSMYQGPMFSASTAQGTRHAPALRAKASPATKKQKKSREQKHQEYLGIMAQELARNMKQFAKMKLPKVYHMRYRMRLSRRASISATNGQVVVGADNRKSPARTLRVSLRVGNHKFDNTGADGYEWRISRDLLAASMYCPAELTPFKLRKMLWRNTDRSYRIAVGRYWRKRYVRSIKPVLLDKAGDFTKEPPTKYMAPLTPKLTFDKKKWKGILKRVSALSKRAPRVITSAISLNLWEDVILGVGNDGSKVRLRKWGYNWSIALSYLGKSKEYKSVSDSGYARFEKELPTEAFFKRRFLSLWKNLRDELAAPEGDPDQAPAIVDPTIGGAMFYDILMVRLESGRFLRKQDSRVFAKKLNQQILPTFLTVIDNPLMRYWGKIPLSSHYLYDDQWVRSRRLVMVKNGVLKNFYVSRKPYKNFQRSNGHGRNAFYSYSSFRRGYAAFSRPGVAIVKSSNGLPQAQLRNRLIQEIKRQGKRYGYILKRFQGSSSVRHSIYTISPEQIFRVDATTGKLTRVKGLRVRTGALQVIQGILATGNDYTVFNGSDNESSGSIQISTVVPSLLIRRLSFTRLNIAEKKNYQIPPPFKATSLQKILPKFTAKPKLQCPKVCPDICKKCAVCQKK